MSNHSMPNHPVSNHLKGFRDIARQHRALAVLKALRREVSYGANEEVMREWLDSLALGGTREQVREDLDRLKSLGVIEAELRGHAGETLVFWLVEKGLDYLEFRIAIEELPVIGPAYNPY